MRRLFTAASHHYCIADSGHFICFLLGLGISDRDAAPLERQESLHARGVPTRAALLLRGDADGRVSRPCLGDAEVVGLP